MKNYPKREPGMEYIRVAVGSAAVLGLRRVKMLHAPTTMHLLQYSKEGCRANCAFCPQATDSHVDKKMLSRVSWPEFSWPLVKDAIARKFDEGLFSRVCLQTVVYPSFIEDMMEAVEGILGERKIAISVAIVPVAKPVMERLKEAGVDRVGIALDAATPALFSEIKGEAARGPYTWVNHWKALDDALDVFGKNKVSTHIIIGLGEREKEIIDTIQHAHDLGITVGLFAFTPVTGTRLATLNKPLLQYFRKIQLARHLIVHDVLQASTFAYDDDAGQLVSWGMTDIDLIAYIEAQHGKMFETSGCPGCNRPYYTESPLGPVYNHPARLDDRELQEAITLLFPGT
jgi:lipoyl synthase